MRASEQLIFLLISIVAFTWLSVQITTSFIYSI